MIEDTNHNIMKIQAKIRIKKQKFREKRLLSGPNNPNLLRLNFVLDYYQEKSVNVSVNVMHKMTSFTSEYMM